MAYQKKGNDAEFRRVSLRSGRVPEFEAFESNTVTYQPDCVLEVKKTDGTTTIEYEWDRATRAILKNNTTISIPKSVPVQRLWVRERDKNAMAYKIPDQLNEDNNHHVFEIPAGANKVEVFGDKYFSAVFDLINP